MKNIYTYNPAPRSWQFLSGTGIKIAGIVLMTLDHLHQMFIAQGAPYWLNWFGRPVAAMFLFLCAEGFTYTRSRKRYMLRFLGGFLFMAAMNQLLSAIMFMEHVALINNIFGTLFMAAYYMWVIDCFRGGFKEKRPAKILSASGAFLLPLVVSLVMFLVLQSGNHSAVMFLFFIPSPLFVEGGLVLVFMGAAFYLLRKSRLAQAALVLVISALSWYSARGSVGDFEWLIVFAVIPLLLYNGKRGKGGGKYFFYIYYPTHVYLLYCIAWVLS
ncbi:MAG: conjugal transfer protein TraX [Spirochaetaceae bacterium]|jgi:hypothetical protein|nr:conjugal transfer protein TraX [Spirochaetaceae bacterium]